MTDLQHLDAGLPHGQEQRWAKDDTPAGEWLAAVDLTARPRTGHDAARAELAEHGARVSETFHEPAVPSGLGVSGRWTGGSNRTIRMMSRMVDRSPGSLSG